jgi:hypothetical protein
MSKQIINVGNAANDRTGDPLRVAFQKTNSNFSELYQTIDDLDQTQSSNIDRSWLDSSNKIFDVVEWNSGTEVFIDSTPFETVNAVTYDSRTDSEYVFFVWDDDFIENIWNGYNTPEGEGQSYSISVDDGETWIPVYRSGYSNGNYFYFYIPYELLDTYSFTYEEGQTFIIKYNRGSFKEVWFDLANFPASSNTNIVSAHMSVLVEASLNDNPSISTISTWPNLYFSNSPYDDNVGSGEIRTGDNVWSGSEMIEDNLRISIRRSDEPEDAGRIYCTFNDGLSGNIKFYWNAKLYTITNQE